MSSNILIAIIASSVIAVVYVIAVIIFLAWKCKSKDQKHEKKTTYSTQPTMLKRYPPTLQQIMSDKDAQLHYSTSPPVYTVAMPEQVNNKQAHNKKKKILEKVWPAPNLLPTSDRAFIWRENESDPEHNKDSLNNKEEDDQGSFSDRQRKPHIGSIRKLPSHNGKACKC